MDRGGFLGCRRWEGGVRVDLGCSYVAWWLLCGVAEPICKMSKESRRWESSDRERKVLLNRQLRSLLFKLASDKEPKAKVLGSRVLLEWVVSYLESVSP